MMSNLARKQQTTEFTQQHSNSFKKGRRYTKITLGEKILFVLFVLFITFMATKLISAQAAIYEVNKEIQDVEKKVEEQRKLNY